jgi:hypothetical protein
MFLQELPRAVATPFFDDLGPPCHPLGLELLAVGFDRSLPQGVRSLTAFALLQIETQDDGVLIKLTPWHPLVVDEEKLFLPSHHERMGFEPELSDVAHCESMRRRNPHPTAFCVEAM